MLVFVYIINPAGIAHHKPDTIASGLRGVYAWTERGDNGGAGGGKLGLLGNAK